MKPRRRPIVRAPMGGRGERWAGLGLLAGAILATATAILVAAGPPRPDEGLPLRWLRLAATHPIRSILAVFLLLLAVFGPFWRDSGGARPDSAAASPTGDRPRGSNPDAGSL